MYHCNWPGKMGKKLLRSRKSHGNSFSTILRCLKFLNFVGEHVIRPPIKVFRSVANIYNGSGKSQEIVLEIICTHPDYVNYGFLI